MDRTKKGIVYWITGLAGSGKTTIGNALYYKMKKQYPIVLLDGDILKNIVGGSAPGYAKEERLSRAKRYSLMCKMLSDQGIDVIICTISMFDEVRKWNRDHFVHYIEIFLDVPMEVLKKRNKRGLYLGSDAQDELPGLHYEAEFPKNPDIVLNTDGSVSVQQCVRQIRNITYKEKKIFNQDTAYWDAYYRQRPEILNQCSPFATEMMKVIYGQMAEGEAKYLLDLGCGNGRDSVFFAQNKLHVVGIDASGTAIEILEETYDEDAYLEFVCDDFVTANVLFQREYDYCYSRFTLHAINEKQEEQLIGNVYKALKKNGLFMIEARTIHDRIYGLGEQVEKNAYRYNDHYRRFIEPAEIMRKMVRIGFTIVHSEEGSGFSKTETEDPVLLRLIARK